MINWIKRNLFSTPFNSLLTILCLIILYLSLPPLFTWSISTATFLGQGPEACLNNHGACWVFINMRLNQFLYGFYPEQEQWRIHIAYILGGFLLVLLLMPKFAFKKIAGFLLFVIFPFICYGLLTEVETHLWGGLFLTLVIATTGIVLSLPMGILLALGRRSNLISIRGFCIAFIELWRGVPLISVLFMASVMLPLFLPEDLEFDKLLRALIGVTLFSSAYMAEVIRGGLQATPKGQYEAASALGFGYWQTMKLIILPQALKIVIPGIVNTFIGLFKDTTLVLIIGLFDLLGIVQAASTDPKWLAYNVEGYVFAAFGFWIFCFAMSRYSLHLEQKLHQGKRS